MENTNKLIVCTQCFTYNQASFILDALHGFVAQQTEFPVIYTIVDDASTDDEPQILRVFFNDNFCVDDPKVAYQEEVDYGTVLYGQHKDNKNCYFAILLLNENHYSQRKSKTPYLSRWRDKAKYIALCEGDDYWSDSKKLQIQADFLETHPKHSLCFCAHRNLLPSGETKDILRYKDNNEVCPINDIILGGGGYMATNSMFYRNSMFIPYTTWTINCPVGDCPLMLTLAQKGLVGYIADIMCVYRILSQGSWSSRMSSSLKKRYNHHQSILRMWRQFDNYTNYEYHNIVNRKMRNNKIRFLKDVVRTFISKFI
jgi:glycosyltransferase involved in cell wall biosynthesis